MLFIPFLSLVLLNYKMSLTVATGSNGITFSVAPVEPKKFLHPEVRSLLNVDVQRWANRTETLTLENAQLVYSLASGFNYRVKNAFIATVFEAYSHHYPLEFSVEDIWVLIAQGVSIHLNENAEKFRHLFVSHDGKKTLELIVDNFLIPKEKRVSGESLSIPAVDWPVAVRRMCELIKADMKTDLASIITQPFSETTPVQQAVFDASLMDSVKAYYGFMFSVTCGIPQVTIHGSSDDFQLVLDRLNQLKVIFSDLHWWLDPLISHVAKFKDSVEGKPDIDWWRKMVGRNNEMSGSDKLTGWLVDFIPYIGNGDGNYRKVQRDDRYNNGTRNERRRDHGIEFSDLNEAVTQTDFILNDKGDKTKMKLIAGFLGIGQNPETGALRPILGWLTAVPSPKISEGNTEYEL